MYNVKQQLCNRDKQIEDVANHWGKYGTIDRTNNEYFTILFETILKAMGKFWLLYTSCNSRNMLNQQMFLVFWCIK